MPLEVEQVKTVAEDGAKATAVVEAIILYRRRSSVGGGSIGGGAGGRSAIRSDSKNPFTCGASGFAPGPNTRITYAMSLATTTRTDPQSPVGTLEKLRTSASFVF